jgi:AraC-like DNA-binding protein
MHTTDADYARDRLTSAYGATHFDVPSRGKGFEAQVSHLQMGDVRLYCCDYANQASLEFCETSFVRQIFNLNGSAAYTSRGPGEIAEGSCSKVLQSNVPLTLDTSSNYRHFVLSIEQTALKRHLGALLGREIAGEITFHDSARKHGMRRLQRLVFQFASDFDDLGDSLSPPAVAEITRGLIMNFLISHDHDYSNQLFNTPPPAHLSTTRRAEEFIEANWDKPIDIEQLSAIARVSVRTLFRQFKKDRGYAPAEFVRRIRLDRARNMLESGIEGTTVTQAALRCGFQNTGHFAREFRLTFGELPSETLRRARRGRG